MERRMECIKRNHKTEFIINTVRKTMTETVYRIPGNIIIRRKCHYMNNIIVLHKLYNDRIHYKLSIGYELQKSNKGKIIHFMK